MKSFISCIFSFIVSSIILYLFYTYISIPIVPVFTLYIFIEIINKLECTNKSIICTFFLLLSILCIYIYSYQVYASIKFYPDYGNAISIIFDILTILAFISTTSMFYSTLKNNQ